MTARRLTVAYGTRTTDGPAVHTALAFSDGSTGRMTWLPSEGTAYRVERTMPDHTRRFAMGTDAMTRIGVRA